MRNKLIFILLLTLSLCVYSEVTYSDPFGGEGAFGSIINYLKRVTTSIIPSISATYDLGSSAKTWRYGYFGDLQLAGSGPDYTLAVTGGDTFGWHAESQISYWKNDTDGRFYWLADSLHNLQLVPYTTDGKVGINKGIADPAYNLDVTGTTNITGNTTIGGNLIVSGTITGSGVAPTTADYLVGTANGSLSAEIVVGTTPGGELGNTWASPTIDDSVAVTSWNLTTPTITTSLTTSTPATISAAELDRLDGLAGIITTDVTACTDLEGVGLAIDTAVLKFAPTELESVTFGGGAQATVAHTFANSGTDVVMTYSTGALAVTGNISATNLSGSNTGDNTVATSGDAALDFFGAGVTAVTDATACTDIEGTSLTITTGVLNVDDDFLKLGGDVASAGVYDFGSASVVLEIPNAAAPTTDATGEMAIDTNLLTQGVLQVYLTSAIANVVATTDTPNDNEIPTYDSAGGTVQWEAAAGGGAPTDADYLVGTANGSLSAEIVVGTTPGGSLGGTWASPTIDDLFVLNTGDNMTGDLSLSGTGPDITWVVTGGDTFGLHTETNLAYFKNDTDSIFYWLADGSHNLNLVPYVSNGKVGINKGVGTPAFNLDVTGTTNITGNTTVGGNLSVTGSGLLINGATVGTSGVGVIAIKKGTIPSSSPASETQLYTQGDYVAGFSATGGTITTVGSESVHTFLTGADFVVTGSGNVKVLVVAGGGGGGGVYGGGGGAGGIVYNASYAVTAGTYTVTVGGGGPGNTGTGRGTNGTDSTFGAGITGTGGGGGGGGNDTTGANGGCGGGGTYAQAGGTGSQGYNGGAGKADPNYPLGGGGGMGAVGGTPADGNATTSGAGGVGLAYTIYDDSSIYYSGGGGGGGTANGATVAPGAGGNGGGGAGGTQPNGAGVAGTANKGGGGGGGAGNTTGDGADGGSGIVIVRFTPTSATGAELKVRDEVGNVTTLSPHNFDNIPKEVVNKVKTDSNGLAWTYHSEKEGKEITVDMFNAIKDLETVTGKKYIYNNEIIQPVLEPKIARYFAEIKDNIVQRVTVAETKEWCETRLGGQWVETSMSNSQKNYAGKGYIYYPDKDDFSQPQPYPSWKLDNDLEWLAPIEMPKDGKIYKWNEDKLKWETQ